MASRTGRGAPRCALCGESGDQKELTSIGGVLQSIGPLLGPFQHNTYVHRLCALWSPEVYHEGDQIRNVMAAVRRGRSLRCTHCGRKGATVGCCVDWCQKTYHIRCAQKAGCEINALEWILSCPEHSRRFRAQAKTVPHKGRGKGQSGKDLKCVTCVKDSHENKRPKLSHPLDSIRANLFGDAVDVDEEYFQKKQEYRIQRDIKALKPYTLGSSTESAQGGTRSEKAGKGGSETNQQPTPASPFDAGWESVGGHEEVKRALKEAVLLPLMYQNEFSRLNLSCPKGVLLYGEPGTGKTMVVRALAKECNRCEHIKRITFFSRKGADLLGKFQGEAERKLRILFQEAQSSAPSIIFFDELDGIAPARGGRVSDQIHTSVVSTLLSLMDGLVDRGKVVVIAATNRADAIDPALRRPGRFDREIYFPLPDVEQRAKILSACTRQWNVKPEMAQIDRLAVLTEGFAGADLQNLCTNAALARLRREFPNILDGVEENKRIENFESKLDSIFVEDRDFVLALQNITKACSHRTISGMLTTCNLQPIPSFVLDAIWRPLYISVCACNNVKPDAVLLTANQCPMEIKKYLEKRGAVSSSVLISAIESKIMARTQQDLTQPMPMPNTNILISGEMSSSLVVAESVLSTLSGFRITKISLPQVILDGHDNIANGMISLTTKALHSAHSERIAIYCPNIHDWLNAVDAESLDCDGHLQNNNSTKTNDEMTVWNSFMQALQNNRSSNSKLVVLATCNLPRDRIPPKIKSFFEDARGETRSKKIVEMEGVQEKLQVLSTATAEYLVSALSYLANIARSNAHSEGDPPLPTELREEEDVPSNGKLHATPSNNGVEGSASMNRESTENEKSTIPNGTLVDDTGICPDIEKRDDSAVQVQTTDGPTATETHSKEYLCAISLDVGANLKCSSDGCDTRIHSKYLRHLELGGSQKDWKCELCRRKQCFGAEELDEISKVEMEIIKGVGMTLLNDQRCGLSHARSTEMRRNSVSLAFLDVASNACKGKYKLMSHLKAAGKLALSGILEQQTTVDNLAVRRGAAQKYFVSTSAAFATMDKIESFCWKFNQFVANKNPQLEPSDEQLLPASEASKEREQEGLSLETEKAKEKEEGLKTLPTLQPQIFHMPFTSKTLVDQNKSLTTKVAGVLEKLLCRENKLGHVQDCIFKILTHLFLSISQKAFETKDPSSEQTSNDLNTEKHLEQLLFESIQHCLGVS